MSLDPTDSTETDERALGAAARTEAPSGGLLELLTASVRHTTRDPRAQPREGQARLRLDIDRAMRGRGMLSGIAPTGSGKSFATLTAAVQSAVLYRERTVLSTDSLALMSQLQSKDVPTVLAAAADVFPDEEVLVAFVKGVSNYVDPARVIATAQELTGATTVSFAKLAEALREHRSAITDAALGTTYDLVAWALSQYVDEKLAGDRHSCPVEHTDEQWATVSSSAAEADDGTRFGMTSKSKLARERAADADIIVTNHSILAVQAALGIPVIVGSSSLGPIDHIVVDEAHTLPGHVRSQGAKKLSKLSIVSAARVAYRAAGSPSGTMRGWVEDAERLGEAIESALRAFLAGGGPQGPRRLTEEHNLLEGYESRVKTWTETGRNLLSPHMSGSDISKIIRATSAAERLTALQEAVTAFGRHRSGWARWVEREQRTQGVTFTANVSPVNVGHLLRANLWEFQDEEFPVSVTAISATLPGNYPFQAGLDGQVQRYPSPFDEAYARSALFVPQLTGEDEIAQVTQVGWGNRLKFDVSKHPAWAAEHIARLVEANGGSALVLAAKADDGRLYADVLRRRLPGVQVHSQWDGGSTQRVVAAWRDDIGSVLVGTKSLMTGVDAPGETCTLVIVDRVPRSPSNPVDDARVDEITERSGDKWAADRAVYVTDAALLLSQAAGRLVRATSDTGMVACLDPRLLKASGGRPGSLTYNEQTRQVYMGPLREFGVKIADPDAALRWLRDRAATARR